MSDRSAESSITGYSYQFLITIFQTMEIQMIVEFLHNLIQELNIHYSN